MTWILEYWERRNRITNRKVSRLRFGGKTLLQARCVVKVKGQSEVFCLAACWFFAPLLQPIAKRGVTKSLETEVPFTPAFFSLLHYVGRRRNCEEFVSFILLNVWPITEQRFVHTTSNSRNNLSVLYLVHTKELLQLFFFFIPSVNRTRTKCQSALVWRVCRGWKVQRYVGAEHWGSFWHLEGFQSFCFPKWTRCDHAKMEGRCKQGKLEIIVWEMSRQRRLQTTAAANNFFSADQTVRPKSLFYRFHSSNIPLF